MTCEQGTKDPKSPREVCRRVGRKEAVVSGGHEGKCGGRERAESGARQSPSRRWP